MGGGGGLEELLTVVCATNSCLECSASLETLNGILPWAPVGDSVVLLEDLNAYLDDDGYNYRGVIGRNGILRLKIDDLIRCSYHLT